MTFVIQNIGGVTLTNGEECHYVVGLKNALSATGFMFSGHTSSSTWKYTVRHDWCNDAFRNAIPEIIRGCFKQFKCIAAQRTGGTTNLTSDDYFALPAEKEVYGKVINSATIEADALIQFEWYKNKNNQYKLRGDDGEITNYWSRSAANTTYDYCICLSSGSSTTGTGSSSYCGLSPFGCI